MLQLLYILKLVVSVSDRQSLLSDEQVANCPVCILGNKIDIPRTFTHFHVPLIYILSHLHVCIQFVNFEVMFTCTGAASQEELIAALGLQGQLSGRSTALKDLGGRRPIELFMCSVKNRAGYGDGKYCYALLV